MKVFGALGRLFKAADAKASQKIEDVNITEFAEQDLEQMRSELQKVTKNCGEIKGRIMTMSENIADKKKEVKDRTKKAEQLLSSGADNAEDLAGQQCAIVERLETEAKAMEDALSQQKQLLTQQEANKRKLQDTIRGCESELSIMKTQQDVIKSNESLSVVNMDGAKSASSKFADRQKRMRERMNISKAMAEEQNAGTTSSLDEQTNAALGTTAGSALLEKLKAKNK